MLFRSTFVLAASALISAAGALPAMAIDLTGTWEGKSKCEIVDRSTGEVFAQHLESTLRISQSGPEDFVAHINGRSVAHGVLVEDATNPGKARGLFTECGVSGDPSGENAIVRIQQAVTNSEGGGKLRAEAIFSDSGSFAGCAFSYKRASMVDPNLGTCP